MSDGIAPFRLPDGEAPFPYSFRGEGHILGRRQELQDGGLYDRLDDAASAGDARRSVAEGPPLADPPRAADRLMTPESSVDDLGSLEDGYEGKTGLQPTYNNVRHDPSDDRNDEAYGISSFIAQLVPDDEARAVAQADMARRETKTPPDDSWSSEVSFTSQLHESPRHVSPPPKMARLSASGGEDDELPRAYLGSADSLGGIALRPKDTATASEVKKAAAVVSLLAVHNHLAKIVGHIEGYLAGVEEGRIIPRHGICRDEVKKGMEKLRTIHLAMKDSEDDE